MDQATYDLIRCRCSHFGRIGVPRWLYLGGTERPVLNAPPSLSQAGA